MIGWDGYATDNAGRYVAPDTNRHTWDWVRSVGSNLGPGNTERESALTEGTMWKYLGDLRLYRSPLSESENIRTYSLSANNDGGCGVLGDALLQIASVGSKPSETICVVTEFDHGHNINGWGISPYGPDWIDKLMIWDAGYFNFAFADGHVERYKWAGEPADPAPIEEAFVLNERLLPRPRLGLDLEALFPSRVLYGLDPGPPMIRRLLLGGLLLLPG